MRIRKIYPKTENQIVEKIAEDSKNYKNFKNYIDDAGWEEWMDDYCYNLPTETEIKNIEKIQKIGYDLSH